MKANVKLIRKRRRFSTEFKKELVDEFESGKFSVHQLSRLYKIHPQVIYDWIYKFSKFNEKGYRVMEKQESSMEKISQMEKRIKELEAALGRKQIQLDFTNKMIELAEEEYGIDIKKNSDTQQSGISGETGKS